MTKYKTKPEIVEAVRYYSGYELPAIEFLGDYDNKNEISMGRFETDNAIFIHNYIEQTVIIKVKTPMGIKLVHDSDFIVKDNDNNFYVYNYRKFQEKFELINC